MAMEPRGPVVLRAARLYDGTGVPPVDGAAILTEGNRIGLVAKRDLYRAGGMAIIPAREWHWHGATPSSPASHLSIRPRGASTWPPEVPMNRWAAYLAGDRSEE
jgi:hypothetical protein